MSMEATHGPYRARVDHQVCVGSENCTLVAHEVFVMNDESRAEVRGDRAGGIPEDLLDDTLMAAEECPVMAIAVWKHGEEDRPLFP